MRVEFAEKQKASIAAGLVLFGGLAGV